MDSLLLTDEEVLEAWHNAGDYLTWGEYTNTTNKAQLKKVVEWLKENSEHITGEKMTPYYRLELLEHELESLLKEIE